LKVRSRGFSRVASSAALLLQPRARQTTATAVVTTNFHWKVQECGAQAQWPAPRILTLAKALVW
jgi:hypothetical protein